MTAGITKIQTGIVQALGTISAGVLALNGAFMGYWGFAQGGEGWSSKHLPVLFLMATSIFLICLLIYFLTKPFESEDKGVSELENIQCARNSLLGAIFTTISAITYAIFLGVQL